MISQIYASAKRHKRELTCSVTTPDISHDITEEEKLGLPSKPTTYKNIPCIKSQRSRRREDSQTGTKYVSVFSLLIDMSSVNTTIIESSTIELLGKKHTIFSFDHDIDGQYWKVELRDE